ncbi:hypothetical protein LEP1GSC062_3032 [Leptospira alexanderi serovar Manhao 3 str. L 60]|uniref:Uncharacterized protein n=1 Tax=Leptospira alexanderi serovar Manhao 3 str. L 60 TaxID=1049759 RepID=V6HWY4_9LEPT|nr:hypothetical protein LEP1GSC062_3032 [Leptospira alexanderi serovar Manhao 3 str. L 60]
MQKHFTFSNFRKSISEIAKKSFTEVRQTLLSLNQYIIKKECKWPT